MNNSFIDRRLFIKISGLMALRISSEVIFPHTSESAEPYKVSRTVLAMGTTVSMTLISASMEKAEEAMGLAYEEINRLSGLMNRFDDGSPISQLNRDGILKYAHPDII